MDYRILPYEPITEEDLLFVYDQLKDKYPLTLTTTKTFDDGFTIDTPIIVGRAHGQIITLYAIGDFVLDVMDEEMAKGTHGHPVNTQVAIGEISEFMEGKSDYELVPFPKN